MTEQKEKEILEFYMSSTKEKTMKHFKISWYVISCICEKYDSFKHTRRNRELDPEDYALMQALRDDGMSANDIADKFDIDINYVYRHTCARNKQVKASTVFKNVLSGEIPKNQQKLISKGRCIGVYVPPEKAKEMGLI